MRSEGLGITWNTQTVFGHVTTCSRWTTTVTRAILYKSLPALQIFFGWRFSRSLKDHFSNLVMQNMENSLNLFSLSWNTGLRKTEKITSKTSLYTGIVAFSLTEWKNEAFNSLQNKLSQKYNIFVNAKQKMSRHKKPFSSRQFQCC